MRVGIGFDIHRLEKALGNSISLGGIPIQSDKSVVAHSDGDVILHALIDGILGAMAWGDIGDWFSDQDEENRNQNSVFFLKRVLTKLLESGHRVNQVDINVFLEKPKLNQNKLLIKKHLCELLDLDKSSVNVKAKTFEQLGPVGQGLAIASQSVVLIERIEK